MARLGFRYAPVALLLAVSPAIGRAQHPPSAEARLRFDIAAADSPIAASMEAYAREGVALVESFFGRPFPRTVLVRVFPDRAAFDHYLHEAWGMEDAACWMVGGAEEEALVILSPRVWREEACDHDPEDDHHVRDLVAHELVHVYHMQANPTNEFGGVEGLDWFVEGLATLVSGQLDRTHGARAREAVEKGEEPASLDDAWTGPYRYGVSGSLVAFVAERVGRSGLAALLEAASREELLAEIDLSEPKLLAQWRAWVLGAGFVRR